MLRHITIERCECGAGIHGESFKGKHSSGERHEERIFSCGSVVQWEPNFSRHKWSYVCPKSREAVELGEEYHRISQTILQAAIAVAEGIRDFEVRGRLIDGVRRAVAQATPAFGAPWWMR